MFQKLIKQLITKIRTVRKGRCFLNTLIIWAD